MQEGYSYLDGSMNRGASYKRLHAEHPKAWPCTDQIRSWSNQALSLADVGNFSSQFPIPTAPKSVGERGSMEQSNSLETGVADPDR